MSYACFSSELLASRRDSSDLSRYIRGSEVNRSTTGEELLNQLFSTTIEEKQTFIDLTPVNTTPYVGPTDTTDTWNNKVKTEPRDSPMLTEMQPPSSSQSSYNTSPGSVAHQERSPFSTLPHQERSPYSTTQQGSPYQEYQEYNRVRQYSGDSGLFSEPEVYMKYSPTFRGHPSIPSQPQLVNATPPTKIVAKVTKQKKKSEKPLNRPAYPPRMSDEYKKRRLRNNVAVRRSRDKAKHRQKETLMRVSELTQENSELKVRVQMLSRELHVMRSLFNSFGIPPPQGLEAVQYPTYMQDGVGIHGQTPPMMPTQ